MAPNNEEQKEDERAQRDLVSYAKTLTADIYLLLDLPSPFASIDPAVAPPTDAELGKAWRRAALKYHPDKNRGDEKAAADRLDDARRAWEVLKDPEARAAYEGKRRAESERRQREQALEGRRRGLAEALRQREEAASTPGGTKRGYGDFSSSMTPAGEKEAKLRRLEEEGRRRRMEFQEAARKRREETTRTTTHPEAMDTDSKIMPGSTTATAKREDTRVPELDRTIRVRWPRGSPLGDSMTSDTLRRLFARFGAVESAAMLKDKKTRPSVGSPLSSPSSENERQKKSKKQVMASAVVMFESIVAAHAAVHDALLMSKKIADVDEQAADPEWALLDSVGWAGGNAPDLGFDSQQPSPPVKTVPMKSSEDPFIDNQSPRHASNHATTFNAPPPFPGMSMKVTADNSTPAKTAFSPNGKGPTFSFGTKGQAAANGSPKSAGTPSNYEATMMRLKEAERKKLEAQIREDDARAQAQEQSSA